MNHTQPHSADTREAYGDVPAPPRFSWAKEPEPPRLPSDFFWLMLGAGALFGTALGVATTLLMVLPW